MRLWLWPPILGALGLSAMSWAEEPTPIRISLSPADSSRVGHLFIMGWENSEPSEGNPPDSMKLLDQWVHDWPFDTELSLRDDTFYRAILSTSERPRENDPRSEAIRGSEINEWTELKILTSTNDTEEEPAHAFVTALIHLKEADYSDASLSVVWLDEASVRDGKISASATTMGAQPVHLELFEGIEVSQLSLPIHRYIVPVLTRASAGVLTHLPGKPVLFTGESELLLEFNRDSSFQVHPWIDLTVAGPRWVDLHIDLRGIRYEESELRVGWLKPSDMDGDKIPNSPPYLGMETIPITSEGQIQTARVELSVGLYVVPILHISDRARMQQWIGIPALYGGGSELTLRMRPALEEPTQAASPSPATPSATSSSEDSESTRTVSGVAISCLVILTAWIGARLWSRRS